MAKAQATMEFLLTYWWAILIIIILFGIFAYIGITDFTRVGPEICEAEAPLTCIEKPSLSFSDKTISFVIRNNLGFDIEIYNITRMNKQEGGSCKSVEAAYIKYLGNIYELPNEKVTIRKEHNFIVVINCSEIQKGKTFAEFKMSYVSKETGLKHHTSILVKGVAN